MSWKSVSTQLPRSAYHQSPDSIGKPTSHDWATPHPLTLSAKHHGLGLGSRETQPCIDGIVSGPPVAQVLPNMPGGRSRHISKPTGDTYYKRDQPQHTDLSSVKTADEFAEPKMEETVHYSTYNYGIPHQHTPTDGYKTGRHGDRTDAYTYDIGRHGNRTDAYTYDSGHHGNRTDAYTYDSGRHGNRTEHHSGHQTHTLPSFLTYNPVHNVMTSPVKYNVPSTHSGMYSMTDWQQQQPVGGQYQPGGGQYHSTMNTIVQDPTKWDALIKAKEGILQEKDKIIEKQKLQIEHMHDELRKRESKERLQIISNYHDGGDLKIQEYQYENATLKAHIAELASNKNTDINKLGEVECELQETLSALQELALAKKRESDVLQKQINEKEQEMEDWKCKYNQVVDKYDKLKNRSDTLDKYLEELPTVEEDKMKSTELKHLKDKDIILAEKICHLEKEVNEAKRIIRSKNIKITALESQHSDMKMNIESLEAKLNKMKINKVEVKSRGQMDEDDIEELQYEHHNMKAECARLKKLIESKHNKLKTNQSQHQSQVQQLEERIQQEEDTVTALREALSSKEESLKNIQTSMKELARQSQEMYEHNLNLEERLEECTQSLSEETLKVYQKLMKELSGCLCDLQGVIQICMQRADGQDPNMTLLLGLQSSSSSAADSGHTDDYDPRNIHTMKHKLTQVRQMRQEIEQLRTLITDKYAEDIGDNCITQ